ncbi:hypothetical protein F4V43_03395 [Paenibacillus spiritus]|uniref:Uncharacterized protein n=1 Tax=Paenibacillus spiritus TaxID=2496557 RepID=A0A5J5GH55_9BACL|nr:MULTISPECIES: hypothetical protein [Paenibacillus]KAA9007549.1 hypothetical protein F4V43_03395 [Paenibacillus spiritus]
MSHQAKSDPWATRFVLKEHAEEYGRRNDPPAAGQPAVEELILMRDYTLLPHMLTIIQKNLDDLRFYKGVLRDFYTAAGEYVAQRISQDLYELRRELSRRSIRVGSGEQDDIVIKYMYKCRGYTGSFDITREETRAQIGVRFGRYVDELMKRMRGESK